MYVNYKSTEMKNDLFIILACIYVLNTMHLNIIHLNTMHLNIIHNIQYIYIYIILWDDAFEVLTDD